MEKKMNENFSEKHLVMRRDVQLLIGAVFLGLLGDQLFYKMNLGLSVPLFIVAFYSLYFGIINRTINVKSKTVPFLLVAIFLLALSFFIRSSSVLWLFDFMLLPFLIVLHTLLAEHQVAPTAPKILFDLLFGFLYRPFAFCLLPFQMVGKLLKRKSHLRSDSVFIKILIGIGLTVPLLLVIIPLLASADQIFNRLLGQILQVFNSFNLGSVIGQTIFTTILAVCSFSYLWTLLHPQQWFWTVLNEKTGAVPNDTLDSVIVLTILAVINMIYLVFTAIQFSYLFGKLPQGFTYASYARHGFFELVAVTLINLTLLLSLFYFDKQRRSAVAWLESLLIGCTLIMLVSAFTRMAVYEQMYGYTRLRLVTHAFMLFLAVLLLFTLYRIWQPKVRIVRFFLLAALTFIVAINYVNIDYWIAKSNIDRYQQTGKIDCNYLVSLSDDAVPQLVHLLGTGNGPVRQTIARDLSMRERTLEQRTHWQSFNLSDYQSLKLLEHYRLQQ